MNSKKLISMVIIMILILSNLTTVYGAERDAYDWMDDRGIKLEYYLYRLQLADDILIDSGYPISFDVAKARLEFAVQHQIEEVELTMNVDTFNQFSEFLGRYMDYIVNVDFDNEYRSNISNLQLDGTQSGNICNITLDIDYITNHQEMWVIDRVAAETVASIIKDDMTELDRELAIIDWIVANFEYDDYKIKDDAFDAIMTGETVCYGYAIMFHKMAKLAGLESYIVLGRLPENDHSWNAVKIYDKWYYVDLSVGDKGDYYKSVYVNYDDNFIAKYYPTLSFKKPQALN